jgi:hypothetical protein
MTPTQVRSFVRSCRTEASRGTKAEAFLDVGNARLALVAIRGMRRAHRRAVNGLALALGVGAPVPIVVGFQDAPKNMSRGALRALRVPHMAGAQDRMLKAMGFYEIMSQDRETVRFVLG